MLTASGDQMVSQPFVLKLASFLFVSNKGAHLHVINVAQGPYVRLTLSKAFSET